MRAAFAKLTTDGGDATAAARAEVVAIGSGPGERTVGGATLAAGWTGRIDGQGVDPGESATPPPSGTTGWVAAQIELQNPGYEISFDVVAVFDKAPSGEWTLVAIANDDPKPGHARR